MKAKIKSWDKLKTEFGVSKYNDKRINTSGYYFNKDLYDSLPENRIVEIKKYKEDYFNIVGNNDHIMFNGIIECYVSDSYEKKNLISRPICIGMGLGLIGVYIYNKLK